MNRTLLALIGLTALLLGPVEGLTQAPQDPAAGMQRGRGRGKGGGFAPGQFPNAPQAGNPNTASPSGDAQGQTPTGQDNPGGFGGRRRGGPGGSMPGGTGPGGFRRGGGTGPDGSPAPGAPGQTPPGTDAGATAQPGMSQMPILIQGDGSAQEETVRPVVYRAGNLPPNLPDWFAQLDTDRDGQVALYEWKAAGGPIPEFERMDLNRDGFVTAEELLRFQTAQAKQMADGALAFNGGGRPQMGGRNGRGRNDNGGPPGGGRNGRGGGGPGGGGGRGGRGNGGGGPGGRDRG